MDHRLAAAPPALRDSLRLGWTDAADSQQLALDVFERVNAERLARGAPALAWDQELANIAGAWSEEMIRTGRFEHSPESFRAHPLYGTGENIAYGQQETGGLHVGWMKSEGHRLNLLHADYDAMGVGIVCREDGVMWATQVFGRSLARTETRAEVDRSPDPIVRDQRGIFCGGRPFPR